MSVLSNQRADRCAGESVYRYEAIGRALSGPFVALAVVLFFFLLVIRLASHLNLREAQVDAAAADDDALSSVQISSSFSILLPSAS